MNLSRTLSSVYSGWRLRLASYAMRRICPDQAQARRRRSWGVIRRRHSSWTARASSDVSERSEGIDIGVAQIDRSCLSHAQPATVFYALPHSSATAMTDRTPIRVVTHQGAHAGLRPPLACRLPEGMPALYYHYGAAGAWSAPRLSCSIRRPDETSMASLPHRPSSLRELRESGWKSKTVKQEIRDNFMQALSRGDELFPGIIG